MFTSLKERFKDEVRPRLVDRLVRSDYVLQSAVRRREGYVGKVEQLLLLMRYRELLMSNPAVLPGLDAVGFRSFSQTDEDGKLLYIFALIGTTDRRVIEVCASEGIEANATNLIVHHGWDGLLFDGSEQYVQIGKRFYNTNRETSVFPPRFVHAWITRDNINDLIRAQGFEGEIDLFSLDIDGMDFWVWQALEVVRPRVMVVEYLQTWGPDQALAVPYRDDFFYKDTPYGFDYTGASLAAYTKLGKEKGYRLVGCNRYQYNAFFVRDGIGEDLLPEVSVASCLTHPRVLAARQRLPTVEKLEWVSV